MHKRWTLLLVAGLLTAALTGCGNKENQEPTEVVEESAVDNTTADSDDTQSKLEELPPLVEEKPGEEEPPVYGAAELVCSLPAGFEPMEDEEGLYVHKSYPKDLSSISYVISESDEDVTLIAQETYKELLEADFYESYGDEVEVNITQYSKIRVDGRNGLKVKLNYEFKGIEYEELIYMIYNGDESHILSYTQEKDGKWAEKFEESGDNISLKPIDEK